MLADTFKYGDLKNISVNTSVPLLELKIMLAYILKVDEFLFTAYPETIVNFTQAREFYELLTKRINKVPLAYLINRSSFWDLDLFVNTEVLIPRSTTELLVEKALELLPYNSKAKLLELGTGSGAICLAIAKHRPLVDFIAIDINEKALDVAKINAQKLKINQITFLASDWFSHEYFKKFPKFDMIVSNPPYIAKYEQHYCDPEIFFEPNIALFAEQDGLASLNQIIDNSVDYLNQSGYLLLEHGFNQKLAVLNRLNIAGFSSINHFKDLANLDRMVIGKL